MGVKTCLWLELEYNTDQVKFAAKNVKAKFIACEISVKWVCNCSMFCCTLLYVLSSIATILMGKRELVALLNLSSWCLAIDEWLFLALPWGCLQFVIVVFSLVFPDHTHYFCYIWRGTVS